MSILDRFRKCGELPVGVEVEGVVHRAYELKPTTIADLISSDKFPGVNGRRSHLLNLSIVKLGELKGPLPDHVFQQICLVDFESLMKELEELEGEMRTFRKPPSPQGGAPTGA